ncbi:MAG: L-threonylcarbamoyladenylate synthase [Candidatus Sulfobium sp.]|jgi:L-threonylcarbamoyladenylate synthase
MVTSKVALAGIERALAEARRTLERGGVVAFPTETFYGLAVRYDDREALQRLYELKHRPADKAMPLIAGEKKTLLMVALPLKAVAEELAQIFWPGPLTMLTAATEGLSGFLTGGTTKVAVRIPGESFALRLARFMGIPLTATSANISGHPPAQSPDKVVEYFGGRVDLLVDEGRTPGGKPSTIIDVTGPEVRIVREGAISREEILTSLRGRSVSARHRRPS